VNKYYVSVSTFRSSFHAIVQYFGCRFEITLGNLRDLHFLSELVDLLQVGDLILRVDETYCDVSRDAAVAVDVSRRAAGRHRDAGRLAKVRIPDVVVEHKALKRTK